MMSNVLPKEQLQKRDDDAAIQLSPEMTARMETWRTGASGDAAKSFACELDRVLSIVPSGGRNNQKLARAKELATTAVAIATTSTDEENNTRSVIFDCMAELLFSQGSRPMHRPLLSVMKNLPLDLLEVWHDCLSKQLSRNIDEQKHTESVPDLSACMGDLAWMQACISILEFKEHVVAIQTGFDTILEAVVSLLEMCSASVETYAHPTPLDGNFKTNEKSQESFAPHRGGILFTEAEIVTDCVALLYPLLQRYDGVGEVVDLQSPSIKRTQTSEEAWSGTIEGEGQRSLPLDEILYRLGSCLVLLLHTEGFLKETLCSIAAVLCIAWSLLYNGWSSVARIFTVSLSSIDIRPCKSVLPCAEEANASIAAQDRQQRVSDCTSATKSLRKLPLLSLLCMFRGLLQTIPMANLSSECISLEHGQPWSLLLDGILPMLCTFAYDVHEPEQRFQALQTLSICLERFLHQWRGEGGTKRNVRWKGDLGKHGGLKSDNANMTELSLHDPHERSVHCPKLELPTSLQQRILDVLWINWVDPSPNIGKISQSCFLSLLNIVEVQDTSSNKASQRRFLETVANSVLLQEPSRKGRYGPLMVIIPRIGARTLLQLHPELLQESIHAIVTSRALCGAVASMLGVFWATLRKECDGLGDDDAANDEVWRGSWNPYMIPAICSRDEKMRRAVCTYALPPLIAADPHAVDAVLAEVMKRPSDVSTPACIAVMNSAQDSNITLEEINGMHSILARAVRHKSESIRLDALQFICVHPKALALPNTRELEIVDLTINLTLRCTSAAARQRTLADVGRLLARIRFGCAAVLNRPGDFSSKHRACVAECEYWLQRLSGTLMASLYPESQYGRKFMAMELMCTVLDMFGEQLQYLESSRWFSEGKSKAVVESKTKKDLCSASERVTESPQPSFQQRHQCAINALPSKASALRKSKSTGIASSPPLPRSFQPFYSGFVSRKTTRILLNCIQDPWDRIREASAECLLRLPAPLPGLDTVQDADMVLKDALRLLHSPRMKDADAGARLILILFGHLVLGLRWRVRIKGLERSFCLGQEPSGSGELEDAEESSASFEVEPRSQAKTSDMLSLSLQYLDGVIDLVENDLRHGERHLQDAARQSLAHGSLLALRYLLPAIPWRALKSSNAIESWERARICSQRLVRVARGLSQLIIPVLSSPEEMTAVGAADVDAMEGRDDGENATNIDEELRSGGDIMGPEAQIVTCACWMTAKEIALVLGSFFQVAPIVHGSPTVSSTPKLKSFLLSLEEQEAAGAQLFHMLLEGKHNGAVDKTQNGFTVLASALLASPHAEIAALPSKWLEEALTHMQRSSQSLRDIVRRSAGLPYAIVALFKAKPSSASASSGLAALGMRQLLSIAGDNDALEPWPRVHAFNCLRMAFLDTEITHETSKFYSQGVIISIGGLTAREWEVRNAAMLCYTALLMRMMGFANLSSQNKTGKWTPTASDFFALYPDLQPFLLHELTLIAEQLTKTAATGSYEESHPSLGPVLTLLLRLRPDVGQSVTSTSPVKAPKVDSSAIEETLRHGFVPLLQKCSAARSLAVRQRVAKALPPVVARRHYAEVCKELSSSVSNALGRLLSERQDEARNTKVSFNMVQGQLLQLEALMEALGGQTSTVNINYVLQTISTHLLEKAVKFAIPCKHCCAPVTHSLLKMTAAAAQLGTRYRAPGALKFTSIWAQNGWKGVLLTLDSVDYREGATLTPSISNAEIAKLSHPMVPVALKEAVMLRMLWSPLYSFSVSFQNRNVEHSEEGVDGDIDNDLSLGDGLLLEYLSIALRSRCYEVRCAALKSIRHTLQGPKDICMEFSRQFRQFMLPEEQLAPLWALLRMHISVEQHPKALRRSLEVLALALSDCDHLDYDVLSKGNAIVEVHQDGAFYDDILEVAKRTKDPSAKAAAVLSLGPLLRSCMDADVFSSLKHNDEDMMRIQEFLTLMEQFSQPAESYDLREAVARAISSSRLLEATLRHRPRQAEALTGERHDDDDRSIDLAILFWTILIKLLQDEEVSVRNVSASCIAAVLQLSNQPSDLWSEVVVRESLPALTRAMGPSRTLLRLLIQQVCLVEHDETKVVSYLEEKQNRNGSDGLAVLGGRLFERESDNQFEEPLLLSQAAAPAVIQMVSDVLSGHIMGYRNGHSGGQIRMKPHGGDDESRCNGASNDIVRMVIRWGTSAAAALCGLMKAKGWAVHGEERSLCDARVLKSFPYLARLLLAVSTTLRSVGPLFEEEGICLGLDADLEMLDRHVSEVVQLHVTTKDRTVSGAYVHVEVPLDEVVELWNACRNNQQRNTDTGVETSAPLKRPWNPDRFLVGY